MKTSHAALLALVLALAGLGWLLLDAAALQALPDALRQQLASWRPAAVAAPPAARSVAAPAPHVVRKCVGGERVVYTDGDCPAHSRAQQLGGNVTVLPAPPARAVDAPPTTVRDLALKPGEPTLQQRRLDDVR
jgi:hypothetical protein